LDAETEKAAPRFSGPRKSSFEPALEGQMRRDKRSLHRRERLGLFWPEKRHSRCGRRAAGRKHRRLGRPGGLDHRHALHLPESSAIGLTDAGQAREEGSQEKQQFQSTLCDVTSARQLKGRGIDIVTGMAFV
jgi:hypothetical protein